MAAPPSRNEPIFLVPGSVVGLALVMIVIEIVRGRFLSPNQDYLVILTFAFIPARYMPEALGGAVLPGGWAGDVWTFFTYALLHGDLTHLFLNVLWMMAFGTALARRFGTARFLVFSTLAAVAGALAHLAFHFGEPIPVVGASAAVSGQMAAATRFVFDRGAPLGLFRNGGPGGYLRPALPLVSVLSNGRALVFIAVWFGINLLVGLTTAAGLADGVSIAWEAHIGGFLFGLLAFPLFDPVRRGSPNA